MCCSFSQACDSIQLNSYLTKCVRNYFIFMSPQKFDLRIKGITRTIFSFTDSLVIAMSPTRCVHLSHCVIIVLSWGLSGTWLKLWQKQRQWPHCVWRDKQFFIFIICTWCPTSFYIHTALSCFVKSSERLVFVDCGSTITIFLLYLVYSNSLI